MFPVRFVVFQFVQLQLRDGFRQEVVFDLLMSDVIAAGVQYAAEQIAAYFRFGHPEPPCGPDTDEDIVYEVACRAVVDETFRIIDQGRDMQPVEQVECRQFGKLCFRGVCR